MIELEFLAWLSVVAAGVAVPAVFAEARIRGWLGRRRNNNGLCGRCKIKLPEEDAEASRIGGVLHCPNCTIAFRRDMTIGFWVAAGIAVLVPLLGGLGVAGLHENDRKAYDEEHNREIACPFRQLEEVV